MLQKLLHYLWTIILGIFTFISFFYMDFWQANLGPDWKFLSDFLKTTFNIRLGDTIAIALGLLAVLSLFIRMADDKRKTIEEEKGKLEEQLKDETKELWRKFTDMMYYRDRESIYRSLKMFVNNNRYVLGVQLYRYTIKERFSAIEFKLNHRETYVAEAEELNALIQEYELIHRGMYKRFVRAVRSLESGDLSPMARFINKYSSLLRGRLSSNSNVPEDVDALMHAFLILGTQYIADTVLQDSSAYFRNIRVAGIDNDMMYAYKRTGLLRAIVNDECNTTDESNTHVYTFRHRRYNNANTSQGASKQGRTYLARTFQFQNQRHILLIIVHPALYQFDSVNDQLASLEGQLTDILRQHEVDFGYNPQ